MTVDPVPGAQPPDEKAATGRWDSRALLEWSRTPPGRRALRWMTLVAVLGGVGIWWWMSGREVTDDATVEAAIHPVAPRIRGVVAEVLVDDNETVTAGQILVRIDETAYRVRLERARADLAEAEAVAQAALVEVPIVSTQSSTGLETAEAVADDSRAGVALREGEVEAAGARLEEARAEVRRAEAEHERAATDRARLDPLLEKDEISRQEYDSAVGVERAFAAALDAARAALVASEQEVTVAEERLEQAHAQIRQSSAALELAETGPRRVSISEARATSARARVEQARAALRQAELDLSYAEVRAPADGVIARRTVETGQFLEPGQTILQVVALDDIWVVARFKETQLRRMRAGQQASIRVDAYRGSLEGEVVSLAPATTSRFSLLPPQNATGNFVKVVQRIPVKIVLTAERDPAEPLRPGMSVVARVSTR